MLEARAPAVKATGYAGVTCHDLRHAYASVLIGAGQSVKVVSERLGHSNAAMTLNVYSHLWPADEDKTRQAVDAAYEVDAPRARPGGERDERNSRSHNARVSLR